jgi:YHS domain-containing protein
MSVDPEKTQWVVEHKEKKYYFCKEGCMRAFIKYPDRFT